MRIRRILLAAVPALIILAVIFRFSSQDRAASTQTSRTVARAILEVVKTEEMTPGSAAYLGTLHEIQVVLRKIAHGVEFAALGLEGLQRLFGEKDAKVLIDIKGMFDLNELKNSDILWWRL